MRACAVDLDGLSRREHVLISVPNIQRVNVNVVASLLSGAKSSVGTMLLPRCQPFTVLPSLVGFYANQHTASRTVSARAATATRAPFPRLGNGSMPNLGGLSRIVDDSMKVEDVKIRYVQVWCCLGQTICTLPLLACARSALQCLPSPLCILHHELRIYIFRYINAATWLCCMS